jgi:hypothetical protein
VPDPVTTNDSITILVERANHLEQLLASNLFGFLLTGTFTGLAAVWTMRAEKQEKPTLFTPRQLFIAANILYMLVSGYYYFMLAQFYATIVALAPLTGSARPEFNKLWSTLRVPSFGVLPLSTSNFLMLFTALLLPLVFSILVSIGLYVLIEEKDSPTKIGRLTLATFIGIHLLYGFILISQPFLLFLSAIGL